MKQIFFTEQEADDVACHQINRCEQKRQQSTSQCRIIKELDDKISQITEEPFRLYLLFKIGFRKKEKVVLLVVGDDMGEVSTIG